MREQWQTQWNRWAQDAWALQKTNAPLIANYRVFGTNREQALRRARMLVPPEAWRLRNEPQVHQLNDGRWYAHACIVGDEREIVVAA